MAETTDLKTLAGLVFARDARRDSERDKLSRYDVTDIASPRQPAAGEATPPLRVSPEPPRLSPADVNRLEAILADLADVRRQLIEVTECPGDR